MNTPINNNLSVVSTNLFSSCSTSSMASYLKNNNIFVIHTHGKPTEFKIGENRSFSMTDIQYTNLSNLDFALFLTCSAGANYNISNINNNRPVNLVEQFVLCGVETVIGFNTESYVSDCNRFAPELFDLLVNEGMSFDTAISFIKENYLDEYTDGFENTLVLAGNINNTLR